jgi:hypothetical protein
LPWRQKKGGAGKSMAGFTLVKPVLGNGCTRAPALVFKFCKAELASASALLGRQQDIGIDPELQAADG